MWPIPSLNNNYVSISLSPEHIICSWVEKSTKAYSVQLNAYQRYNFSNLELTKGIVFNPSIIKKYIDTFLKDHNLSHSFISLSIEGDYIKEKYISFSTSLPPQEAFKETHSFIHNYHYLYAHDEGQHIFYTYKIPRCIIFQYQLFAIQNSYNIVAITSKTAALFYLYKAIFGSAFRTTQFGLDMIKNNNAIESLITPDTLRRTVYIPTHINFEEEYHNIAMSYGLFSLREDVV